MNLHFYLFEQKTSYILKGILQGTTLRPLLNRRKILLKTNKSRYRISNPHVTPITEFTFGPLKQDGAKPNYEKANSVCHA